jgi:microcystin-dependent protein
MTVSVPYTFQNGTAADADQVNQNFDALVDYVNTEVPLLTGERSYTGALDFANFKALRVGTPTEPTDGANKQYADSVIPVGVIQMFAGPDAKIPLKWVKCNGQALSRSTYSDLFNAIGTSYGIGDGVNTFNVPNFTGAAAPGTPNADGVLRFPYPANPGTLGGSHNAVVVSHTHPASVTGSTSGGGHEHTQQGTFGSNEAGEHGHNIGNYTQMLYNVVSGGYAVVPQAGGGWASTGMWNGNGYSATYNPGAAGRHAHSVTISGSTAGGGGHGHGWSGTASTSPPDGSVSGTGANVPAYLGVNFIIRTGV